jgi:hypothetical protein
MVRRLTYLGLVWVVTTAPTQAQSIVYVDVSATAWPSDGSSWGHAFRTLDEALAIAGPTSTIRIANGIYRPSPAPSQDPRAATFHLIDGVVVEGGYAGC